MSNGKRIAYSLGRALSIVNRGHYLADNLGEGGEMEMSTSTLERRMKRVEEAAERLRAYKPLTINLRISEKLIRHIVDEAAEKIMKEIREKDLIKREKTKAYIDGQMTEDKDKAWMIKSN